MSMSSAASGVSTPAPQQQQLPPPKQIRFVNNEGQPPAKRRRINAACVLFRDLSQLSAWTVLRFGIGACGRMRVRTCEVLLLMGSSIEQLPDVSKT